MQANFDDDLLIFYLCLDLRWLIWMKRLMIKSQDKTLTQVGVHLSVILSYFWKACVLTAFLISLFCLFIQIAVKTLMSVQSQHFSWPEFTSVSAALPVQPEVQSDRDDYQVSQSSDQHFSYRS